MRHYIPLFLNGPLPSETASAFGKTYLELKKALQNAFEQQTLLDEIWVKTTLSHLETRAQSQDQAHLRECLAHLAFLKKDYLKASRDYEKLPERDSSYPIQFNLGLCAHAENKTIEAKKHYQKALELNPHLVEAHEYLADILGFEFCFYQQYEHYIEVLELRPNHTRIYYELFKHMLHTGMAHQLPEIFAKVMRATPEAQAWFASLPPINQKHIHGLRHYFHARLILYLYGQYKITDTELFQNLDHWDRLYSRQLKQTLPPLSPQRKRSQRLKVGYLSKEFDLHSPIKVFGPLLANHDHGQFEIHAFSDTPKPDFITERLKEHFDHWHDTAKLKQSELFEYIRSLEIDILVDLGGHTHRNRLLMFGLKAAPVQVTGLGFIFSTGMQAMDYVFVDKVVCPPPLAAQRTEIPYYLKSIMHWQPPEAHQLDLPPFLTKGHITFGSSNTLNKLCPEVIALWSRILNTIPHSRLALKTQTLDDPLNRDWLHAQFRAHGIEEERLELYGWAWNVDQTQLSHEAFFYPKVDIGLDPFPYTGAITACDSLWMGVPLITLYETQIASRALSSSILNTLGLNEWIAQSQENYLQIAVQWARHPERLLALRPQLRDLLKHSTICDGIGFAKEVEGAYLKMWQEYIQNTAP